MPSLPALLATLAALAATPITAQQCLNYSVSGYSAFTKVSPSPGGAGFRDVARPWNRSSCCTAQYTSVLADQGVEGLYNFSYNYCGNISAQCKQYLQWEEAAFSCDPYMAYYQDPTAIGTGTLLRVPVCQSFCDSWFDACADDRTCVTNWWTGFNYSNNAYSCPIGSTCQTFRQRYGNGAGLCRLMWDQVFTPSTNESSCYSLWFWGSNNPNSFIVATPCPALPSPSPSGSRSVAPSPSAASWNAAVAASAVLLTLAAMANTVLA